MSAGTRGSWGCCDGAGGWLTGRSTALSLADKEGEIVLTILQLLSSFYMESKSKEENYLAVVSVSKFPYPWQNYFD